MNRYYVTIPEGHIKYYPPSEQEVKRVFPEANEITPLDNTDHLYFVEQIQDQIEQELGKGRWIIDTVFGKMEYQQFYDPDEPSEPLDGCKYRLIDSVGHTFPVTWQLSTPEDFYNVYMKIVQPEITGWERYNYLEWAKLKKDGYFWKTKIKSEQGWFWVNYRGEVYEVDNQRKAAKDLWKKFKNNPDTVKIKYWIQSCHPSFGYFANRNEYETWFDRQINTKVEYVEKALPPNPDLAKNVFKLPWYPIPQSPFTDWQIAQLWKNHMANDMGMRPWIKTGEPYSLETLIKLVKEIKENAI